MTITVVAVEPIGYRKIRALGRFVRGGCREIEVDEAIPPAEITEAALALQGARMALDLSLREAATRVGLLPGVVSGLEWGRYAFERTADREEYLRLLRQEETP